MDCSPPGSLSVEFTRQEYQSGLPFSPPGDLPDPRIEPASPALTRGFLASATSYSLGDVFPSKCGEEGSREACWKGWQGKHFCKAQGRYPMYSRFQASGQWKAFPEPPTPSKLLLFRCSTWWYYSGSKVLFRLLVHWLKPFQTLPGLLFASLLLIPSCPFPRISKFAHNPQYRSTAGV